MASEYERTKAEAHDEAARATDRALADAAALDRLAAYPEWAVLDRLMGEHADRVLLALRARGLDLATTEALRAELDTIDWLRYRPVALRRALETQKTYESAAPRRDRSAAS